MGTFEGNNVTLYIDGQKIGTAEASLVSADLETMEPTGVYHHTASAEGTMTNCFIDLEPLMLSHLTKDMEKAIARQVRLEKYRQQAREGLIDLKRKQTIARARQLGKGW